MDDQYLAENLDFLEITKNKKGGGRKKISYGPLPDDSMRSNNNSQRDSGRQPLTNENPQSRGKSDS